jgi:RNA polymerase sigma factor (TIGR02999 family)
MSDVTRLLDAVDRGEPQAAEELLPLVYGELRRIAAAKMATERPGQTIQATALVHEAWLRLVGENTGWRDSGHFIRAASEAMRRILVDRARRRNAAKHGGSVRKVSIEQIDIAEEADDGLILLVHDALEALATEDPEKAELIKLRFFVGMRIPEAAEYLGISPATAKRQWTVARAWLLARLTFEAD